MSQENNDKAIITDLSEAKEAQDIADEAQASENQGTTQDPLGALVDGEPEFDVDTSENMENQVGNLHGKLLMRVLNKIKLTGQKIGREDVQYIANAINQVMEQKLLYAILERLDVDGIEDVIDEDEQEQIVNLFQIKTDLSVSQEDMKNLDLT